MRTMALLECTRVAVTAVTVQNTLEYIWRSLNDVVAGQAVVTGHGVRRQDRDAGPVAHRCDRGRDLGRVCFVRSASVADLCASMHGDRCSFGSGFRRTGLFVGDAAGPPTDEARPAGRYASTPSRSGGQSPACAGAAGCWSKPPAPRTAAPVSRRVSCYQFTASSDYPPAMTMAVVTRWRPGSPPRWRTVTVPDAVDFGKRSVVDAARGLSIAAASPFRLFRLS